MCHMPLCTVSSRAPRWGFMGCIQGHGFDRHLGQRPWTQEVWMLINPAVQAGKGGNGLGTDRENEIEGRYRACEGIHVQKN